MTEKKGATKSGDKIVLSEVMDQGSRAAIESEAEHFLLGVIAHGVEVRCWLRVMRWTCLVSSRCCACSSHDWEKIEMNK